MGVNTHVVLSSRTRRASTTCAITSSERMLQYNTRIARCIHNRGCSRNQLSMTCGTPAQWSESTWELSSLGLHTNRAESEFALHFQLQTYCAFHNQAQ